MQIVKNLGNYETCRLEATFILEDGDNLNDCFILAKSELEKSFEVAYKKETKEILDINSKVFERVCKALKDGKCDLDYVKNQFTVPNDCMDYFKKYKLI